MKQSDCKMARTQSFSTTEWTSLNFKPEVILRQMAHRDVVDARAAEQHIFIREISGRFVVEGEQPFLDGKPYRHAHHALGEREHHMRIAAGIRLPAPLRDDLPMAEHHRAVHMDGWAGIQLFKKSAGDGRLVCPRVPGWNASGRPNRRWGYSLCFCGTNGYGLMCCKSPRNSFSNRSTTFIWERKSIIGHHLVKKGSINAS